MSEKRKYTEVRAVVFDGITGHYAFDERGQQGPPMHTNWGWLDRKDIADFLARLNNEVTP